jgi:hypothetical protein
MTDEQFYDITPVELHHAFKDFEEVETNRIKIGYERMRLQTMYLVNTQLERNKQFKDPKRLMKFKWDELKQMSQQELVNKVKALATIFKGRVKVKKKKKE